MKNQETIKEDCLNVLIVDDAIDIHPITINAFYEEKILGKPLHFFSVYNEHDAIEKLNHNHKSISVILLDIVMKKADGGLKVIQHVRNTLNNHTVQIIIRSGHSSLFPMREIINRYDIHDYLEKGNTTEEKLFVSLKSGIQTYQTLDNLESKVSNRTQELNQIFNVSTPLIQIDTRNHILKTNESFRKLFQIEDQIIGKTCYETLSCRKCGSNDCSLKKLMNGKYVETSYEDSKILPDGKEIIYQVNAIPIKDKNGNITSVIENFIDITKLKIAERKIRKDQNRLKSLAKTAEKQNRLKGEFLSQVSHDVRTPINSILLNTNIVKKQQTKECKFLDNINSIETSSQILIDLIDDILTFSVLQEGKLELQNSPTNIQTIVNEINHLFKIPIENNGLLFHINIDKNLPGSLLLDRKRIRQILINLISNANKYTEKGFVKFSLEAKNISKVKVDLLIKVEDTGIGIPQENQTRVFNAFEMVHGSKSNGIGLGLSIVKQLVDIMGGVIELKSEEGKGSSFKIIIPSVEISSDNLEIKGKFDTEKIIFDESLVLIVDDNYTVRKDFKKLFDKTNINVIEAKNGRDAIKRIREEYPDIVFMDISMPEMNGLEAAKYISSNIELKNIPIIAYTASVTKKEIGSDINFFNGYISKTNKDVVGEIYKVLQQFIKFSNNSKFNMDLDSFDIPEVLLNDEKFKLDIDNLLQEWHSQGFNLSVSYLDSNRFGNSVILVGKKYKFTKLIEYGKLLNSLSVENCGLAELEMKLKRFLTIKKYFK